ncbi:MAG: FAD-dependent oxidoreductase [Bryobacteraceae bacterium]
MAASKEIVVVGGGAFGSWIALHGARAGHRITLVERVGPANELSSSTGESRIIRSAYGSDRTYTVFARRALRLWVDFLAEQKCPELFHKTGILWMADARDSSLREARTIFEELRIEHEWLNAADIASRYTQMRVPLGAAALLEPEAGAIMAERTLRLVLDAAISAGVRYEVAAIRPPDFATSAMHWVETTEGKRIPGELFVFAAGSWLPKLFPLLQPVIRPTRQELFFSDVPAGGEFRPGGLPAWIDQTDPRIPYGLPDFGSGMKLGFHRLGPAFDPDSSPRAIGEAAISEAIVYTANRFPAMRDASLRAAQVCHYGNTPNGDFLIDQHPQLKHAWLVGGGSGHGFKHAPTVAEYLFNLIGEAIAPEPRFSLASKRNVAGSRVL